MGSTDQIAVLLLALACAVSLIVALPLVLRARRVARSPYQWLVAEHVRLRVVGLVFVLTGLPGLYFGWLQSGSFAGMMLLMISVALVLFGVVAVAAPARYHAFIQEQAGLAETSSWLFYQYLVRILLTAALMIWALSSIA